MEDLFGGECDMFNAAATAENDEDQPADSRTLLQRVQGGTSCMCCTDVPIATAAVISCSLVDAASSSETPHDEQPGNEEVSCVCSADRMARTSLNCLQFSTKIHDSDTWF